MTRPLPSLAMVLGLLGLLPFVGCGLGAMSGDPATRSAALAALIGYGAVILAFLGGVHWGFALDADSAVPRRAQRARFGLGVVPSLLGWVALLLSVLGLQLVALPVLAVSFGAVTVAESRGSRMGFVPRGYMGLRWVLSAVVLVVLVTVWTVQMLGGRLVLL